MGVNRTRGNDPDTNTIILECNTKSGSDDSAVYSQLCSGCFPHDVPNRVDSERNAVCAVCRAAAMLDKPVMPCGLGGCAWKMERELAGKTPFGRNSGLVFGGVPV